MSDKMWKILFILFFLIIFIQPFAIADILYLKNGATLRGEIVEETEDGIWFEVPDGRVFWSHSEIKKIEKEARGPSKSTTDDYDTAPSIASYEEMKKQELKFSDDLIVNILKKDININDYQATKEALDNPPEIITDFPNIKAFYAYMDALHTRCSYLRSNWTKIQKENFEFKKSNYWYHPWLMRDMIIRTVSGKVVEVAEVFIFDAAELKKTGIFSDDFFGDYYWVKLNTPYYEICIVSKKEDDEHLRITKNSIYTIYNAKILKIDYNAKRLWVGR